MQDNGGRRARHSEMRNLAVWRRTQGRVIAVRALAPEMFSKGAEYRFCSQDCLFITPHKSVYTEILRRDEGQKNIYAYIVCVCVWRPPPLSPRVSGDAVVERTGNEPDAEKQRRR